MWKYKHYKIGGPCELLESLSSNTLSSKPLASGVYHQGWRTGCLLKKSSNELNPTPDTFRSRI